MSNTKTPDDQHDEEVIVEQFEGLDNDLVNVGKFTDPDADPGSPDATEDSTEKTEFANDPAIEESNTLKRP